MQAIIPSEWQTINVTVNLSSATWNTVGTHEVFTVTGNVDIELSVVITTTLADSGGATGSIQFGVEGDTDAYFGPTSYGSAMPLVAGRYWTSMPPSATDAYPSMFSGIAVSTLQKSIAGGLDIGYELTSEAAASGVLVFKGRWRPQAGGGSVVAGSGGSL